MYLFQLKTDLWLQAKMKSENIYIFFKLIHTQLINDVSMSLEPNMLNKTTGTSEMIIAMKLLC